VGELTAHAAVHGPGHNYLVQHSAGSGRPPFEETDSVSVPYQQVHATPPTVRTVRPDVPVSVDELIQALLHKTPEQRPTSDEVYELLLPCSLGGRAGGRGGGPRDELDPTRPFRRPMAATPRAAPAYEIPAAPSNLPALSVDEADDAMDRAASLAEDRRFTQAADLLGAAIARADTDGELAAELRFSLGHVLLLADDFRRAAAEFDAAGAWFAERHGSGDETVLDCRYFAATCRAADGEDSRALAEFRMFLDDWTPIAGERHERTIDVRRQIGGLLTKLGRGAAARAELARLHADVVRWGGPNTLQARRIAAMLERVERYEP
jgi:hypothetical protein